MNIFATGVTGQLGYDVTLKMGKKGYQVKGAGNRPQYSKMEELNSGVVNQLDHNNVNKPIPEKMVYIQLDITKRQNVILAMEHFLPDTIIHCAAWTNVDAAEDRENWDKVHDVNASGTRYLAEAAKAVDAKMVYISTDYVFDGRGERPWQPSDHCFGPLNVYGQSKLDGEFAVLENLEKYFVIRTSWVFGKNGNNFVKTMLNVGKSHNNVRVVNDQIGRPTYTKDLARLIAEMVETDKFGIYHATNEGDYISWYDFTCEIYRQAGLKTNVIPVSTEEYGLSKAMRPYNSRLDTSKLKASGFEPLPDWKDALHRYLIEIGEIS